MRSCSPDHEQTRTRFSTRKFQELLNTNEHEHPCIFIPGHMPFYWRIHPDDMLHMIYYLFHNIPNKYNEFE